MEKQELLTIQDVMNIMKVSRSTVYRLMKEGALPCARLRPRLVRFLKKDVDELVNRSRTSGEGGKNSS
jgi:excisionase family DNA binding protein